MVVAVNALIHHAGHVHEGDCISPTAPACLVLPPARAQPDTAVAVFQSVLLRCCVPHLFVICSSDCVVRPQVVEAACQQR